MHSLYDKQQNSDCAVRIVVKRALVVLIDDVVHELKGVRGMGAGDGKISVHTMRLDLTVSFVETVAFCLTWRYSQQYSFR